MDRMSCSDFVSSTGTQLIYLFIFPKTKRCTLVRVCSRFRHVSSEELR